MKTPRPIIPAACTLLAVLASAAEFPADPAAWQPTAAQPLHPPKEQRIEIEKAARAMERKPLDQLAAHPAAADFPGAVPANAPRSGRTVEVPLGRPRWTSTGLYAAPGETVTVQIPADAVRRGLRLRVGAHTDTLFHLDAWRRYPDVSSGFALTAEVTRAGTAFGGLIYIDVPRAEALGGRSVATYGGYGWIGEQAGAVTGSVAVRVENAVPAPLFVRGKTSAEQWRAERDLPAPWGELATDKLILTVPRETLAGLEDPESLMAFWDRVMDASADLAGWPRERTSPERIVADRQISAGHMHSGYPIMCHLPQARDLVDLARLRERGDWGFFHELGHNHQPQAITFDGEYVETTVNLFTMYVMETVVGRSRLAHDAIRDPARLLRRRLGPPPRSGAFENLAMYLPLLDAFGWDPVRGAVTDLATRRPAADTDARPEKIDAWVESISREAGRNLAPYFDRFGLTCSDAVRSRVADLPAWPLPEGVAAGG